MSKHIVEELPARKHAPVAAPAAKGGKPAAAKGEKQKGGTEENSEKRIRQAVYDIRYRARREDVDLKQAYSQYMSNSSLSPAERTAVKDKLFGKAGGVKEQYEFESVEWASDFVANALYNVFVEGVEKEQPLELSYENQLSEEQERKYKVRVFDPKTEKSYVRYATREKITQLRARGLKVEMTEHGEPYEGERKRGTQTARAMGGGNKEVPNNKSGLDKPVHPSKRDGDVNDDGKKDSTDKYIYNRRDAINKAIAKKKGMNEELLMDGTTSVEGQNEKKIDVKKPSDTPNSVQVFPEIKEEAVSKSQQKFMAMVCQVKKGKMDAPSPEVAKAAKEMSEKDACDFAETKHKGLPEKVSEEATCPKCGKSPCECDTRANRTYRELLKNRIRSMGIKNPLLLDLPDEEKVMKIMTSSDAKMNCEGREMDEPGEREHGKKYNRFRRPGPKEGRDYGGMRKEKPINRSAFDPPSRRKKEKDEDDD